MGFMTQIAKFANANDAIGQRLNEIAILGAMAKTEDDEQTAAQRLVDWFLRDRPKIVEHLKAQATITFGSETDNWQFPIINGVPRTIDRLAMTYRKPPERTYLKGGKPLADDSPAMQRIDNMYRRLDIDKRLRRADQWATLLNVAHIEPVFRAGAIDWDIHLRPTTSIFEDPADYLEFEKFAHARTFTWTEGREIRTAEGWIFWTEEEHYFLRKDGRVYSMVEGSQAANPYRGEKLEHSRRNIPIVTIRKRDALEYWGRYGADVVDAFEQANIQLADVWQNLFIEGHGIPIGINLLQGSSLEKIVVGVDRPIFAEGVTKDDVEPNLKFAKPETDADIIRETIDWFIKMGGASYGQPISAWASESKAESGFAKLVENLELIEQRDSEIADWEMHEKQLFEWSRIVFNKWCPASERVDPSIELDVQFSAIDFPEAPADKAAAWNALINSDLASPVDYFMVEHKISDRDEAFKFAQQVAKENRELRGMRLVPDVPPNTGGEPPGQPGDNEGGQQQQGAETANAGRQ